MSKRVVILGAGFGGLELSTVLAEELNDDVQITLIDRNDSFVFGFDKLDVMFGHKTVDAASIPYAGISKPAVTFLQETVTRIDPVARTVTTDAGIHEADMLVVALGADYDFDATPGLLDTNEFYTVAGAEKLAGIIPEFSKGHAVIGVCGAPFKCPPAPSECALLLNDELVRRGVRDDCEITVVIPFDSPVPPSPETSEVLLREFENRGIKMVASRRIASVDSARNVAVLDDGTEIEFDLFLGVPKHRASDVVIESGMAVDGYIPVDSATLKTKYPGVYAVGDVSSAEVPKAGVFAEGAAKVVAKNLIAEIRGGEGSPPFDGKGSCYVEFGQGKVARVDIDFLSGSEKTGELNPPSVELAEEKASFGPVRRARWFGN
ncbi:MAG: FAD-dependent oxidoreductase [Solirubrobacterales bacterium]